MKRRTIHTIILQERKIADLTKRNAALESGYRSIARINKNLRAEIKKLRRQENVLNEVNI